MFYLFILRDGFVERTSREAGSTRGILLHCFITVLLSMRDKLFLARMLSKSATIGGDFAA